MTFTIQIVCDGSEEEFAILEKIAKACNAIDCERYLDPEYCDRGDYRIIAVFRSMLFAETFRLVGSKISSIGNNCVMVSSDEYDKDYENLPTDNVVYLLHAEGSPFYKIGKSSKFSKRIGTISTSCPYPIKVCHVISCHSISNAELEAVLHLRYEAKRFRGEWFQLTEQDIADIKAMGEKL